MLLLFLQFIVSEQFPADFLFRMHNHTGWYGPKTLFDGYSGKLVKISAETNLEQFFSAKRKYPEVLVIPLALLKTEIIDKIESLYRPKPYLQGFIVLNDDSVQHSAGDPFPNKKYSSYDAGDFAWNPVATSMIEQKYEFPIVYPPKSEAQKLIKHMEYYGSKAGAYLRIYMLSRGSSKQCIKDDSCAILGGLSLYGSFTDNYKSNNAVWAIANYDTFGLFPYSHVGADYSISGFVALLAALESFKNIDWSQADKPLRFAFFDGEEVGYLGSTRFLDEVIDFKCKSQSDNGCESPYRLDMGFESVNPEDFNTAIEIKSVATANSLYVHTNKNGREFGKSLVQSQSSDSPLPVEMADESLPGVPPSSTNTFIKKFPTIKHAVLTGYQGKFPEDNRYGYPSEVVYDADAITKASQTLVATLHKLCGVKEEVPKVNSTIVSELMKGLVNAPADSEYMASLFPNARLPTDHVSLYTAVYRPYTLELKQQLVIEILKDSIASNVTTIRCQQQQDCSHYGLSCSKTRGVCINYTMNMHPAYSEAFEYTSDYETEIVNSSEVLPFECEANWASPDLQFVTLPSLWTGRITVGIGLILWVVLAVLLVNFWNYNVAYLHERKE